MVNRLLPSPVCFNDWSVGPFAASAFGPFPLFPFSEPGEARSVLRSARMAWRGYWTSERRSSASYLNWVSAALDSWT
ncbi:hypothetical protein D3C72_1939840 [compost metagenome]